MITHILRDGSKLNTVSGIVITAEQFPMIYKVKHQIEERGELYEQTEESMGACDRKSKSGRVEV